MTKTRSTKRALLTSGLVLIMCITMLIGTTFAWFTDSVTSAGNIIKSGTLDVEMYWAEGTEAPDTAAWKDASTGTIFNYDLWEPGYTEVRHIKIENKGSLALKYQINIIANGEVSKLADVIDVYYVDPAVQVANRTDLAAAPKLGTLTEVLDAINTSASGNLLAGENDTITLALKMQETAGNEYQGLAIGSDFSVQLLATQLTAEKDSFDNQYDLGAEFDVAAKTADELATALKAGGKVKLANDIAVDEVIVIPEGVVSYLDLNGKALSSANVTSTYALNNLGTLTIYDSSSKASAKARSTQNGTGSISARGIYNGYSADGNNVTTAKLTVLSGNFNAMGTNGGAAIYNYGEVVVTGGDFESNGGYGLNNQYGKMTISNANVRGGIYNTGELTINNSTVYQHISGRHAIYNWTGSVIVNGGEFDSESGNELILADGTNASVVINDGTFNKTAKSWLFGAATNKNITFAINGGTFNGYVNKPENTVDTIRPYGDKFDITGGTFNFDPTKWVVDGYIAINNGNGTYTVVKGVAVNDSASLKNAIANGEKEIYAYGVVVEGTSQLNTGATIVGATFKASVTAVTQTVSGTFKDCVFEGSEPLRWCYSNAGETVVFENCEIKTTLRGVHFDDMKGDVVFKNCKINGFNAIGGDGTVTFEKCTFGNDRSSYNGLNMYSNINLIDCTFNFESGKTNFIDMEGTGKTLTITNCKAFLDGTATDIRNFVGGSKLAQNTVVYN